MEEMARSFSKSSASISCRQHQKTKSSFAALCWRKRERNIRNTARYGCFMLAKTKTHLKMQLRLLRTTLRPKRIENTRYTRFVRLYKKAMKVLLHSTHRRTGQKKLGGGHIFARRILKLPDGSRMNQNTV